MRGAALAVPRVGVPADHARTARAAGCAVPNTGVRIACSIDRSRGHFSGWRSGKSQCAPVAPGRAAPRHGRPVGRVEVGAPAGDAGPQLLAGLGAVAACRGV